MPTKKKTVGRPKRPRNAAELAAEAIKKKKEKDEQRAVAREQQEKVEAKKPEPAPAPEPPKKVSVKEARGSEAEVDLLAELHKAFPGVGFALTESGDFIEFTYRSKHCRIAKDRLDRVVTGITEFIGNLPR